MQRALGRFYDRNGDELCFFVVFIATSASAAWNGVLVVLPSHLSTSTTSGNEPIPEEESLQEVTESNANKQTKKPVK
jgi:hypothetical protein